MIDRTPPPMLEEAYAEVCRTPSDINEHLPILRQLASECEHVTEMGMRTGVSTIALLAAQPTELISWDIDPAAVLQPANMGRVLVSGRTKFQPRVGDTLKIHIEPTDLLFIDTLHTWKQLRDELFRHCVYGTQHDVYASEANKDPRHLRSVRKYLVFHDTVTFGDRGEDGSEPGLRASIRLFQQHTLPMWELLHDFKNNNGLVVLKRVLA